MRAGRNALARETGYQDRRNALAEAEAEGETNRFRRGIYTALTKAGLPPASARAAAGMGDFVPVFGDASNAEDSYQAFSRGDMLGGALAAGATALGAVPVVGDLAAKGVKKGIRAYHGSPHDFDRFDMSKIGTGEGAQAYGHGLYFAESEGVARSYRDGLAAMRPSLDGVPVPETPLWTSAYQRSPSVDDSIRAYETALERAERNLAKSDDELERLIYESDVMEAQAALDELRPFAGRRFEEPVSTGRMYEVNINADPEDFLDWDRPLAGQSRAVQERVRSVAPNAPGMASGNRLLAEAYPSPENASPDTFLGAQASQRLRDAGIPGIRYLDQGSRAAGEGSRNYVVFDDSLVEILRKYGIGGLIAGGGAYGLTQQELEQAKAEGVI